MNRKQIAIDFAKSLNDSEVVKLILFGSVTREEDNDDSDIDILIFTTNKKKIKDIVYDKVSKILIETKEYISAKVLNVSDYEYLKFHLIL